MITTLRRVIRHPAAQWIGKLLAVVSILFMVWQLMRDAREGRSPPRSTHY